MKSIVQEASSIAKAIEQGLLKAGNPRDFAVKILEYPERNFFGLTTKPAKIALYCDERSRKPHEPHIIPSLEQNEKPREQRSEQRERLPRVSHEQRNDRSNERSSDRSSESRPHRDDNRRDTMRDTPRDRDNTRDARDIPQRESARRYPQRSAQTDIGDDNPPAYRQQDSEPIISRWSPETVQHTQEWLTRVLTEMHKLVPFSIDIDKFYLKITFDRPLFDDTERERRVLASLSLLILETCKHMCKVNLRDHKVILTHRS